MDHGIYVATSGFLSQQKRLDIITNNLANVNTAGYKEDVPVFQISRFSQASIQPEGMGLPWSPVFVSLKQKVTDFSQGTLTKTENPLDVALSGEGFFVVQTPQGPRYTRKGDFTIDRDGTLITQEGHPVMGEGGRIVLSSGEVEIDLEGNVFVDGNQEGRLRVVAFQGQEDLIKEGEARFAWNGKASDVRQLERPDVRQGYLEMANVNPVREMVHMIEAIRTYEAQQKVIHSFDDARKKAVDEVGRLR